MESSETQLTQQDRMILFRPVELGIVLTFYTLLVKMESLNQKCNGNALGFFEETGCCWDMNGTLCSAAAMGLEDLYPCFDSLHARGMQCESAPVDYYLVDACCVIPEHGMTPYFLSLDDGEIEFYTEDHRECARLKTAPRRWPV